MSVGDGIDLTEVRSLAHDLGRIPAEFHREVRKRIRTVGQDLLHEAQGDASWSTRIPQALSLRVSLSERRPGVTVRASLAKAPHARVYEGILEDVFRHPVYGHPWWVKAPARPYLLPAVERVERDLANTITEIVDDVFRRVGLT